MRKAFQLAFTLLSVSCVFAQSPEEQFRELPTYSDEFTTGQMVARFVDGLGYRFFWATEGLREEDYAFRPSDSVRSTGETIDHIYSLSSIILNASRAQPTIFPYEKKKTQRAMLPRV